MVLGEVGPASTNPAFGLRKDLAGREGNLLAPVAVVAGTSLADSDADTGLRFRPQLPTNVGFEGELQGSVDEQFGLNGKGRR